MTSTVVALTVLHGRERRAAARTMSVVDVPEGGAAVAHALAALLVDPADAAHRRASAASTAPSTTAATHLLAGPPGSASAGLAVLERRAEAMARADEVKAAARAAKLAASGGGGGGGMMSLSSRPSGTLAAEGSHTSVCVGVGVGVGVGVDAHSSSSRGGVSGGVESLAASKPYLKMPDRCMWCMWSHVDRFYSRVSSAPLMHISPPLLPSFPSLFPCSLRCSLLLYRSTESASCGRPCTARSLTPSAPKTTPP